ncbi:MAG TPA: TetR/AcrR family transcriptional regulator [Streptosporangiaceae bacterium]
MPEQRLPERRGRGGSRRRPRNSLNPEVIVRAAAGLVERHGAAALTFANLGRELDAHPTAVYRHFRSKDDLLLAMTDTLFGEVLDGFEPGDDWVETLRAYGLKVFGVFQRHPRIGQMVAVRTTRRENEFRYTELLLATLRKSGLPDADVARYMRALDDFILAYAGQTAAFFALDAASRDADVQAWRVDYPRLSAEQYPTIAAVVHLLPGIDDPGTFETALDLMLTAIEVRAAAAQKSRGGR